MKKSLFALAALGAFATAAQAQSSVTLFGTLDASAQYISNGGVDKSSTNTSIASSTSTPATANCSICLVDGAISTSMWGMKGSEDLGGGSKGIFYIAGDVLVNNGTMHSSGMFRRGAFVGVSSSFGEIDLGLKSNPMVDAFAGTMPVGGNTVNQVRNVIGAASGDFIKNGFQYTSPNLSGFQARLAYGASDVIGTTDGNIMAASATYSNGGLGLSAGYNKATHIGSYYGDPNTTVTSKALDPYSNASASAAQASLYDVTGYVLGAKYNFASLGLPALTLGYAFLHGEFTSYTVATPSDTATTTAANANANMVGLGYQATPNLLIGANWIGTTADSSLYNLQARYSLSKRTTVYAQASMAKNGAGANGAGAPFGNFMPVNPNSSGFQANIGGYGIVSGSSYSGGLPNTTASAVGAGLIHSF